MIISRQFQHVLFPLQTRSDNPCEPRTFSGWVVSQVVYLWAFPLTRFSPREPIPALRTRRHGYRAFPALTRHSLHNSYYYHTSENRVLTSVSPQLLASFGLVATQPPDLTSGYVPVPRYMGPFRICTCITCILVTIRCITG